MHYKICKQCRQLFTKGSKSKTEGQTFCSYKCYTQYRLDNPNRRYCIICGQEIKDKHLNARFCSLICYGKYRHEQTRRPCEYCGKEFYARKYDNDRRQPFCSKRCAAKARTRPPNTFICEVCDESFVKKLPPSRIETRRFCGKECQYLGLSGPNNYNWKGGRDPYYGPNWQTQRRKVRKRDGYICQICDTAENNIDREMDVHHIIPFDQFGIERYEEANALYNLITSCHQCHLKLHNSGLELSSATP